MFFGTNLQHFRKYSGGMTQEQLAQRMGVSRQTISKWESGEVYPDIGKLMELCGIFSCTLDSLLREDLSARADSPVRIIRVERFRMARYIMISPQAEEDVCAYMDRWARASGLTSIPGYTPKRIHWGFPHVSAEQKNRFGLRGHAAACILPGGFEPACGGAEIVDQQDACYAVMTLRKPFVNGLSQRAQVYPVILDHLRETGVKMSAKNGFLPCFEWEYQKNGTVHKDFFVHCEEAPAAGTFRFD